MRKYSVCILSTILNGLYKIVPVAFFLSVFTSKLWNLVMVKYFAIAPEYKWLLLKNFWQLLLWIFRLFFYIKSIESPISLISKSSKMCLQVKMYLIQSVLVNAYNNIDAFCSILMYAIFYNNIDACNCFDV